MFDPYDDDCECSSYEPLRFRDILLVLLSLYSAAVVAWYVNDPNTPAAQAHFLIVAGLHIVLLGLRLLWKIAQNYSAWR